MYLIAESICFSSRACVVSGVAGVDQSAALVDAPWMSRLPRCRQPDLDRKPRGAVQYSLLTEYYLLLTDREPRGAV